VFPVGVCSPGEGCYWHIEPSIYPQILAGKVAGMVEASTFCRTTASRVRGDFPIHPEKVARQPSTVYFFGVLQSPELRGVVFARQEEEPGGRRRDRLIPLLCFSPFPPGNWGLTKETLRTVRFL